MTTETNTASEGATATLMTRDVKGITTDDVTPMNAPTALKAQVVTANDTDVLSLLGQTQTLPLNFRHGLTRRDAEGTMIQQQSGWRRFCSLCSGSADSEIIVFLSLFYLMRFNDENESDELTIPMMISIDRTYIM